VMEYISTSERKSDFKTSGSPLLMMYFQREIEEKAFAAGGGNFVGPAQRMVDFAEDLFSSTVPKCSYIPGIRPSELKHVLPPFITYRLKKALKSFGKRMASKDRANSYYTNEAVLVATESRTSSPVRIPRDHQFLHHPEVTNLFPCGEGAGYAGGIVSAAMDGEKVAARIAALL
jgi:uncharacterized protein